MIVENSDEYSKYFRKSKKSLIGRSRNKIKRKLFSKLIKDYIQKLEFDKIQIESNLPLKVIAGYRNRSQIILRSKSKYCGGTLDEVNLYLEDILGSNKIAEALYYSLNAEIANYEAKFSDRDGKKDRYKRKNLCISELIKLCQVEGFKFGIKKTQNNHLRVIEVIYFDLPGTSQLFWHVNMQNLDFKGKIPVYKKEGYNLNDSGFSKIEQSILEHFPDVARTFDRNFSELGSNDYLV